MYNYEDRVSGSAPSFSVIRISHLEGSVQEKGFT